MKVINFADTPSLVSQYMAELRDVTVQKDMLRFRRNLERIGEIMAYEISKELSYRTEEIRTPLSPANVQTLDTEVVLATIFRAGVPFHQGFLNFFDHAENAFVSAYRRYKEKKYKDHDDFEVCIEYLASPRIDGKTLVLCDPMLATGSSMDLSYRALLTRGVPEKIHVACVVASQPAVEYIREHFPEDKTTLWCGAIDPEINAHSYIVPGLGDAGDLAYGTKE
ncbi:MAG: uracil phosphoribosyltransferase [Muribaculaceae bacterium]|nr:uracil phosphoribosyltransferase [Muribaculaceae bacterium]